MSSAAPQFQEARRRAALRIPPEHLDKLTEAKYDLQAILRRDVTEQELLETYLEGLADFLAQRIAALRQQPQPEKPADRKRRGDKA